MSWLVFSLIGVTFGAVTRLAQRVLLGHGKADPIAFAVVFQAMIGLMIATVALPNGFELPDLSEYWLAVILTIFLFAAGNIALAKSLQTTEASVFTVIFSTSVVWIMLFGAILFNEAQNPWHFVGALLTFVSIALLVEKKGRLQLDRGVIYGLLSGFLMGCAVVGWVYVGRIAEPMTWQVLTFVAPAAVIALAYPKSLRKAKELLSKQKIGWLLLAAFTFAVSTTALLYAYKYGEINQVAPLQQTTIIITVILAVIFLNERKNLVRKFISAAICFVGVLMIVS